MFANCQIGGMNMGFPDVCLTPIPPAVVPIPYPNMTFGPTGLPAAYTVLLTGGPAHNILTMPPLSVGDNAGVNMGVASGMVMGPTRHVLGSFTVLQNAMPATKMTSMSGHNGASLNIPGMTMVPAQVTVMIMS